MTESVPTLVTYAVLGWMALNVIFYISSISGINATLATNLVQTADCRQPFIAVQAMSRLSDTRTFRRYWIMSLCGRPYRKPLMCGACETVNPVSL